jgi:AcrR family transcriptional regulator
MPRKRTIPDETLLDAALAIVHESGPDSLTFAALAPRVGLAPSTIVQRYGTKAQLLQSALLRAWDLLDDQTEVAARAAPLDPSGVTDLLVRLTGQYDVHDFADQLLVLREDLRDPLLRARGDAWLSTLTAEVDRRLSEVPEIGRGLGELIVTYWQGVLTVWSFRREADAVSVVRAALEDFLNRVVVGDD